jgi:hypothetical protein
MGRRAETLGGLAPNVSGAALLSAAGTIGIRMSLSSGSAGQVALR